MVRGSSPTMHPDRIAVLLKDLAGRPLSHRISVAIQEAINRHEKVPLHLLSMWAGEVKELEAQLTEFRRQLGCRTLLTCSAQRQLARRAGCRWLTIFWMGVFTMSTAFGAKDEYGSTMWRRNRWHQSFRCRTMRRRDRVRGLTSSIKSPGLNSMLGFRSAPYIPPPSYRPRLARG